MSDLRPLHGFPTNRLPLGIAILNPSLRTGIPKRLTIPTPVLATSIFMGNDIALINAMGKGNINIKKMSGKIVILVMFFPKRKSDVPIRKKNRKTRYRKDV